MSGALWDLMQAGLIPEHEALRKSPDEWGIETDPFLIISQQDSQMSVLLLECIWENPGDAVYTVWIDDATGCVCGVRRESQTGGESASTITLEEKLVLWADFLHNHCGVYAAGQEIVDSDKGQSTVQLTLWSLDDFQDTCTAILTINGMDFSFVI